MILAPAQSCCCTFAWDFIPMFCESPCMGTCSCADSFLQHLKTDDDDVQCCTKKTSEPPKSWWKYFRMGCSWTIIFEKQMFRYSLHFYFVVPAVKSHLALIFKLNFQKLRVFPASSCLRELCPWQVVVLRTCILAWLWMYYKDPDGKEPPQLLFITQSYVLLHFHFENILSGCSIH